ncbi:MAG: lactate utilization protein [Anaerolineales bacterium]|jgi:L-lactate utilization protein LutC
MDYSSPADNEKFERTAKALESRGVTVITADTKESVLPLLMNLIPEGATVMTGASLTLEQIGFVALLKSGNHRWHNLKAEIVAEKDPARQSLLRKQATLADYFLGSVHAIAETGEILVASATGSQLAPYAYSCSHVIWVAGAQKIVPSVEDGFRRIREYVLPHEDQRMKKNFGPGAGSFIGKILLFEREAPYLHRSLTLLLIRQIVGD